jgi:metal-responsive CopG/Arc/MetJ family transcriptional regulator
MYALSTTADQKRPVRPVQIDLPVDFIVEIDRLAAEEMVSRSAWVRRLLRDAVRAARATAGHAA